MEPNGTHSAETTARVARGLARYHAVRKASHKILPSDLLMIAQGKAGTRAALRPHVADSASELQDLAAGVRPEYERLMREIAADTRALAEKRTRASALAMKLWECNSRPCGDPIRIELFSKANPDHGVDFKIVLARQ